MPRARAHLAREGGRLGRRHRARASSDHPPTASQRLSAATSHDQPAVTDGPDDTPRGPRRLARPAHRAAGGPRPLRRAGTLGDGDDPRRARHRGAADRLRRRPAGEGGDRRRAVRAARRRARRGRAGAADRRAARPGGRRRRHRRRPFALDQRVDDGRARHRRSRRAGVQARRPRRVVAVRDGRRVRGARRGHRADAGRRAAVRRGGGHRLLLRPQLPPGVPLRRPGPPGDRHPHRVQPARPDGQPRAGPAAGDRRRRPALRRADAGVAAGARVDRLVGRARRRARRADDDRSRRPCSPSTTTTARRRSPSTRSSSAWRRRRTSSSSAATRRTTPRSSGACSAPSAAPTATSSCSTRRPPWSSPAWPATCPRALASAEQSIDSGKAAEALEAMIRVSRDAAGL